MDNLDKLVRECGVDLYDSEIANENVGLFLEFISQKMAE